MVVKFEVDAYVNLLLVYFLVPCVKSVFLFKFFFIRDNTAMGMGSETIEWKIELLTVLCICFSSITVGKFEHYFFYRRSPICLYIYI